jgi:hypothetical protein
MSNFGRNIPWSLGASATHVGNKQSAWTVVKGAPENVAVFVQKGEDVFYCHLTPTRPAMAGRL